MSNIKHKSTRKLNSKNVEAKNRLASLGETFYCEKLVGALEAWVGEGGEGITAIGCHDLPMRETL